METTTAQIEVVRSYLKAVRQAIKDIGVCPRHPTYFIFDSVIFGLLSKAFSVADAALVLIDNRHPEEAFGLSRTLVECTLNLRYLTQDRAQHEARALAFSRFFFKEKQFWLYQAQQFFKDKPDTLKDFVKHAAEHGIVADRRSALLHWSGKRAFTIEVTEMDHPLDGTTFDLPRRKIEFEISYHDTSHYVHGYHPGIEHYYPMQSGPYTPLLTSDADGTQGQKTLYLLVQQIHQASRYTMFGAQVESTKAIDQVFSDFLPRLIPLKRRF